jgi:tRNA(Arg) A34 adenosine deaminase TadA
VTDDDHRFLRRAVDLAHMGLEAGHSPYGTLLVGPDDSILFEDHNRTGDGDLTRHPELATAQWAAANLLPAERAACRVYTSGEHCPMCAAAHGFVGLGPIAFVASGRQAAAWRAEYGSPSSPVATLPITSVVPGATVRGPFPEFEAELKDLHRRFHERQRSG